MNTKHIDLNATCRDEEQTALHILAEDNTSDNIAIVKFLLNYTPQAPLKKIDVNAQNARDYTALHIACSNEKYNMVEELLKQEDIDVHLQNEVNQTALHIICTKNDTKVPTIINLLIGKKANLTIYTRCKYAPIHIAVYNNNTKAAEILLYYGVNVNMKTKRKKNRYTPLQLACKEGNKEMVELLFKHKANAQVKTNRYTLMDLVYTEIINTKNTESSKKNSYQAIWKKLHKKNVRLSKYKKEPFTRVIKNKQNTIFSLLINHSNANINKEINGVPLLHYLCNIYAEMSCLPIQKMISTLLKKNNLDINSLNNKGETALHIACNAGKKIIVKLFIEKVCSNKKTSLDINKKNRDEETSLDIIYTKMKTTSQQMEYKEYEEIWNLLIEKKAILNKHNTNDVVSSPCLVMMR